MVTSLLVKLFGLLFDPHFELPDGFALHRKLDVGINGVGVFTARMAHQCLADFLHDSGLHEPRVEGVPKIMETVVADASAADGRPPSGFDNADRLIFEGEDQSLGLC